MNTSEAIRVIATLAAYFPGRPMPTETAALWAKEVEPYEIVDALEASTTLGTMGRFMPSLMEFTDAIRDCRNHRVQREPVPSLPAEQWPGHFCSLTDFLRENPDYAVRVRKLGWWSKTLAELDA